LLTKLLLLLLQLLHLLPALSHSLSIPLLLLHLLLLRLLLLRLAGLEEEVGVLDEQVHLDEVLALLRPLERDEELRMEVAILIPLIHLLGGERALYLLIVIEVVPAGVARGDRVHCAERAAGVLLLQIDLLLVRIPSPSREQQAFLPLRLQLLLLL